jgi:drug/metabolite transporter (DMT)-like permease
MKLRGRNLGIFSALSSAFFLGLAPVFGKYAINLGMHWSGVVALRTLFAAFLVLLVILIKNRQFLYIYPAGLIGCLLAGSINGLGSLLFYGALARINANLGQLLYSLYPLFVLIWLWLDNQPPSRLTLARLGLVIPGVVLLTYGPAAASLGEVDLVGVGMMLGSAALYALHLPINQRVLYDMPAPTVTLYTLIAMTLVVVPAYLASTLLGGAPTIFPTIYVAWGGVLGLTVVTFLSRLTLFLGVKHLGGLQTALLGLTELLVTLVFSYAILGEALALVQWLGAGLIAVSMILVGLERSAPVRRFTGGWLSWLRPPGLPRDLPWPHD